MTKNSVYHYTSLKSLEAIFLSKTIRFGELLRQEKDPYEFHSGAKIFEEEIDAVTLARGMAGKKGCLELCKVASALKNNIGEIGKFFLFYTSKEEDDPYMWLHFADNGKGVCLEIDQNWSISGEERAVPDHERMGDVIYCEKTLRKKLNQRITNFVECGKYADRLTEFASEIICDCLEYKPKTFEQEKEYRI